MRFNEFKLVEQASAPTFYTIGDSHAVAVATAGGKGWTNLAIGGRSSTDGEMLANIAKIPKGATVLVSQGANDTANAMKAAEQTKKPPKDPKAIAANVANVVDKVEAQGATVIFMLFPNGPGRGAGLAKYYGGDYQEQVRDAIKSAIGSVQVIDINGKPLTDGVHATMAVYKDVANQVKTKGGAKPGQAPTPDPKASAGIGAGGAGRYGGYIQVPTGPKMGSRGVEVINLQRALMALGYSVGPTTDEGILGKFTSAAIAKFQTDNKLQATGTATPETVEAVNKAVAANPNKTKLERAKPEEFKGKISVSALGDKESRAVLTKEAQSQGIKGKELAAFLAQCSHESGGFRYLSEIWGPTAAQRSYDGRMGNNQSGDGYRYRGRGYIQLTGKNNYSQAGRDLGLDLVKNPDQASTPDIGAKTSVWFWKTNVQPRVSNWDDVNTITKIVNGGYNGLEDRKMRYAAFTQAMNIA
jgi:predicted chitinase